MIKLGDISEIKGGKRLPKGSDFVGQETKYKYIRARDIGEGKIKCNELQYIDEKTYEAIKNYTVNSNDVCITIVGANIGDVGIVPEELKGANLTENAVKITKFKNYNSNFLLYYLSMDKSKQEMQALAAGAAQPKLGIYKIKEMLVPKADINVQEKVVRIISKYDDLIENNLKRIKLLEETAEAIYKEWFVNFRFPGDEKCEFVDGIPRVWKTKALYDVCEIIMGQSPSSDFYNDNKVGLPFHQGVTNFGERFPEHNKYCSTLVKLAEPNDILFSVRAPVGRLNISDAKIIIGRGLAAIRNKDRFQSFQYYQLKNIFFKDNLIGGGTIFASITKKDLENQKVMLPDKQILKEFEVISKNLDNQIANIYSQNKLLKETRDILIPKLIMGEIEV